MTLEQLIDEITEHNIYWRLGDIICLDNFVSGNDDKHTPDYIKKQIEFDKENHFYAFVKDFRAQGKNAFEALDKAFSEYKKHYKL